MTLYMAIALMAMGVGGNLLLLWLMERNGRRF